MGYTYLEHSTDAIVEVDAKNMNAALADAAESVADITLDISSVEERETRKIDAYGDNMHHALLNWLEAVNYVLITDGFAVRRFEAHIAGNGPYEVSGIAHGEPLNVKKHGFKIEIKAPTLHMMEIQKLRNKVTLRFLLDL